MNKWNNLDPDIRNSENASFFKSNILKFIRLKPNSIYNCHNPKGMRLMAWLRLGLNQLREHKFKQSILDYLYPLCVEMI